MNDTTPLTGMELHILIADDDVDDIDFFRAAVEDIAKATKVTVASEGFELLEFLNIITPDIIFLDINMPKMNGIDCLTEIRARKTYDTIPVIIYSTTKNPKDIERSYELGASMFFEKPPSFDKIKSRLNEILLDSTKGFLTQLPRDKYVVST